MSVSRALRSSVASSSPTRFGSASCVQRKTSAGVERALRMGRQSEPSRANRAAIAAPARQSDHGAAKNSPSARFQRRVLRRPLHAMFTLLKLLQSLVKTLHSDGTPTQIAAGVALGAALGLTPIANVHNVVIFVLLAVLNVSFGAGLCAWAA